jgi:hypothetical protein
MEGGKGQGLGQEGATSAVTLGIIRPLEITDLLPCPVVPSNGKGSTQTMQIQLQPDFFRRPSFGIRAKPASLPLRTADERIATHSQLSDLLVLSLELGLHLLELLRIHRGGLLLLGRTLDDGLSIELSPVGGDGLFAVRRCWRSERSGEKRGRRGRGYARGGSEEGRREDGDGRWARGRDGSGNRTEGGFGEHDG